MKKIIWVGLMGIKGHEFLQVGQFVEFRVLLDEIKATQMDLVIKNERLCLEKNKKGFLSVGFVLKTAGISKFDFQGVSDLGVSVRFSYKVLVQPVFKLGGRSFGVNEIVMQSNLSRCLGCIGQWDRVLKTQIEAGFNFFHMTSVNKLGKFGSLYCIGDYSQLNNEIFPDNDLQENEKLEALEKTVKNIQDMGAGVIVDLVLSHCSSVNPIFKLSQNAVYSLENSPKLQVVFELDNALKKLSSDMEENRLKYRFGNRIETPEQLQYTLEVIKTHLEELKLSEFFFIDTEKELKIIAEAPGFSELDPESSQFLTKNGFSSFYYKKVLKNLGEKRFGCQINQQVLWSTGLPKETILKEVLKKIEETNQSQSRWFSRKFQKILKNIENEIRYLKLEQRSFEVSKTQPLVRSYFTALPSGQTVLLNGFIFSPKSFRPDLTAKWDYLTRSVIPWNDCVKINYNHSSHWLPVLESHVSTLASIFSGFRLDNCHGTPLWVTKHLVRKSREINPNLLILAELFTDSAEIDEKYVKKIGINLLLRDSFGQHSVDSLKSVLDPSENQSILYDFTHDNPTITQLRSTEDALSNIASVACRKGAIGSTRGYDELIPFQLSVVTEKRTYQVYNEDLVTQEVNKLLGCEKGIRVWIEYFGTGRTVQVSGDWDGWKVPIPLRPEGKVWRCCVELPSMLSSMIYGFKFCVDQHQWICDESQRHYKTWDGFTNNILCVEQNLPSMTESSPNLLQFRHRMNLLRDIWKNFGYSEIDAFDKGNGVIAVKRWNKINRNQFWVISRIGFVSGPGCWLKVDLAGKIEKIEFFCKLQVVGCYDEDKDTVNGVPARVESLSFHEHGNVIKGKDEDCVEINRFEIGSVLVIKTRSAYEEVLDRINKQLYILEDLERSKYLFEGLGFEELNLVLWKVKEQENEFYEFPGFQKIRFCGIGGLVCALKNIEKLEESHPVFLNLSEGNWYIEYCLSRLNRLDSKVLYFFVSHLFDAVKMLNRKMIPEFVLKTLRKLFAAAKKYFITHLTNTQAVPKKLLFSFSQALTGKICCVGEYFPKTLKFEHFWAVEIFRTLHLFEIAKKHLIELARSLESNRSVGCVVHFLFQLSEYCEKVDVRILEEKIKTENLQIFAYGLLEYLAEGLDSESGFVLCKAGESWCKTSNRSGALIEVTAMLFKFLWYFKGLSSFRQTYINKGSEITLNDWSNLVKQSFEILYYVPSDGNSYYIKTELVETYGIYKDTLGCNNEELEYRLSVNTLIAFLTAEELFQLDFIKKHWKNCSEKINSDLFIREWNANWVCLKPFLVISGLKLGVLCKSEAWKYLKDIQKYLYDWQGLPDRENGVLSGMTYLGLFSLYTFL